MIYLCLAASLRACVSPLATLSMALLLCTSSEQLLAQGAADADKAQVQLKNLTEERNGRLGWIADLEATNARLAKERSEKQKELM